MDITASEAMERFGDMDEEALEQENKSIHRGRSNMAQRDFGKASFIHIKDRTGRIQAYIRKNKMSPEQLQHL